jgi:hypothetical protein
LDLGEWPALVDAPIDEKARYDDRHNHQQEQQHLADMSGDGVP